MASLSLFLMIRSFWTLIQTQPIMEDQGRLCTELAVVSFWAIALLAVFMTGDTLARVLIEARGTGLEAHVVVQEEVRHALFASFFMDAVLTHLRAMFAHTLHSHVPLGAGFLAHSLVQDEACVTGVAIGGISFTGSASRATVLTYAIFCIKALGALGVTSAFMEEEGLVQLSLALFALIGS